MARPRGRLPMLADRVSTCQWARLVDSRQLGGHVVVQLELGRRHDDSCWHLNVGGRLQTEYTAISMAAGRTLAEYPPTFDVRPSDI